MPSQAPKEKIANTPVQTEQETVRDFLGRMTQAIRAKLKAVRKLAADEYEFIQLINLQWTQAQRTDGRNYQSGQIIQFHQNVAVFRRGERATVTAWDDHGVAVVRQDGKTASLPMDVAARFQVYESRQIALAAGDWIRITQNGFTKDEHRLNNGDLKQVKGFTKDGDIKLDNGWVVSKDYGNLTHGYCLTSYGAQSKGVDCVFVAEGSESFRAADREQFYVSASRFKEALTIYTDDKYQLLEAVRKSSHRPSATDLVSKDIPESPDEATTKKPVPQVPQVNVRNVQKLMLAKQRSNRLRNHHRRSIKA
jgi:ATP-dependent exoDNAse (exonuclease V) alpha subunit